MQCSPLFKVYYESKNLATIIFINQRLCEFMEQPVFFFEEGNNAGDIINKPVLEALGMKIKLATCEDCNKLIAIGSTMGALREGDIVWGTGCMYDREINSPPKTEFLAVRGPLTKNLIKKTTVPDIFGDPALILPLIYKPPVAKKYKLGILPHYVDKRIANAGNAHFIDIQSGWRNIIDEISSCEKVISSSLHGIIFCEAYGVPVVWAKYSDKIFGGEFKFQDYFLGTGRKKQSYFSPLAPLEEIEEIQKRLIDALAQKFKTKTFSDMSS